jgi:hypothetical protein
MPLTISAYFIRPSNYAFEFVTASKEDICMICRSPYTSPENNEEGCQAIRLTNCNHVIGLECFDAWVLRHPRTCPYWSHDLPAEFHNTWMLERVLGQLCTSDWYKFMVEEGRPDMWQGEALNGLLTDQLSLRQALWLFVLYTFCGTTLSLLYALLLIVMGYFITFALWCVSAIVVVTYHGGFGTMRSDWHMRDAMKVICYLLLEMALANALFFSAVVFGVLVLGLSRSFVNACGRLFNSVPDRLHLT